VFYPPGHVLMGLAAGYPARENYKSILTKVCLHQTS
jgi:hypothetical protein